MGIGTKGDWFQVVHKTRTENAERMAKGERSRLTSPELPKELRSEIKCSDQMAEWLAARAARFDENGHQIGVTERCKRRHARREGK